MTLDFAGDPALPYYIGAVLLVLSTILAWRRTLRKPVKRFDVVEYAIVPAVLLGIFLPAYAYIDVTSDYALGVSLALLLVLCGIALSFGPIGWTLWLFLMLVFLAQGNSVLVIAGVGCNAMLAGTLIGFCLARVRLARRKVARIESAGGPA